MVPSLPLEIAAHLRAEEIGKAESGSRAEVDYPASSRVPWATAGKVDVDVILVRDVRAEHPENTY